MAALVTAAEAKILQPTLTGTDEDSHIDDLLTWADAILARHLLDQSTLESTSRTLYLSGRDWVDLDNRRILRLGVWPIASVASIEDDPDEGFDGSTWLVDSGDYVVRGDRGFILLKTTSGHAWSETRAEQIKVVCTVGWANNAALPEQLKLAHAWLVKHWLNTTELIGLSSMSAGGPGSSVSPRELDKALPPEVVAMVAPYRTLRAAEVVL